VGTDRHPIYLSAFRDSHAASLIGGLGRGEMLEYN